MSSAQKTIVSKFANNENEPIASGSGQSSLFPKTPIIFPSEMMLDFLKCLTWKSINKCQGIDAKWFYVIKQNREVGENNKSILPRPIFEKFVMVKSTYWDNDYGNFETRFKKLQNQERHCFDTCTSQNFTSLGNKPLTFTGFEDEQAEIHLGITFTEKRSDEKAKRVFSWNFENEISDESLSHIQHWFSHIREPFGVIKEVKLVPFDLEIWQNITECNPNLLKKIYVETLVINFELEEFDWASDFCSKYCTAKRLVWNLVPYKYPSEMDAYDDEFYAFMEKDEYEDQDAYHNTIANFVEDQGQNFESIVINAHGWLTTYKFASKLVEMFKVHDDPSKFIKKAELFCSAESFVFINSDPSGPPRIHENENSDYILMEQEYDEGYDRQVIYHIMSTSEYEESKKEEYCYYR